MKVNPKRVLELDKLTARLNDAYPVIREIHEYAEYVRNAERSYEYESCERLDGVLYHAAELMTAIEEATDQMVNLVDKFSHES